MAVDGGLRRIIIKHIQGVHWQSIESAMTGGGIPDINGCKEGAGEIWIETKMTRGWTVSVRPDQVGWIERRLRNGGRVFVAVRQLGAGRDDLWLLTGGSIRFLAKPNSYRLDAIEEAGGALLHSKNGPAGWDWEKAEKVLFKSP